MSDRRKEIKRRLREIKHDPGSAAPGEAQRLMAEYKRLTRPEPEVASRWTRQEAEPDPEVAALATWPPELRARLQHGAMSRIIDGRVLDDPGGWGALNDQRYGR